MVDELEETRKSWNAATRIHNAHKKDQAAFLKGAGSTLFPEEVELVGEVKNKRFLHLLCNSGQDTLSFAKRGAMATGVDLSDTAIAFAQRLSSESGIASTFLRTEAIEYLEGPGEGTFDIAFASYGCIGWIKDLPRFFKGVARKLESGGRFVIVEFHPLIWSFNDGWQRRDPYFAPGRDFKEPVSDYVGQSGAALAPSGFVDVKLPENTLPAHSWQHTIADVIQALVDTKSLDIEVFREWPYANGCRAHAGLVDIGGNRFAASANVDEWNLPLMFGFRAIKRWGVVVVATAVHTRAPRARSTTCRLHFAQRRRT